MPEPAAPAPVSNLIVPLDGSELALRALPVAGALAARFGASVHLLGVAASDLEEDELHSAFAQLTDVLEPPAASVSVLRAGGASAPVAQMEADLAPAAVCMATHGRGRSAALLGSTATEMLTATAAPLVLVGPAAGPGAPDAAVVACVDGSPESAAVVETGGAWAAGLGAPLTVLTVAEPTPESVRRPGHYDRAHGPQIDAQDYVDGLAAEVRRVHPSLRVGGAAVYDPISPVEGLLRWVSDNPAQLLVVNTRARTGLARALLGSVGASIARHAPVPVLAARRI
ncbi:MAG: universal stress protein [Acidimicrobiales bacterium]